MYLHIGMNAYVWSGHLVGIFDRSLFYDSNDIIGHGIKDNAHAIRKGRMIRYALEEGEVKSYLLTTENEVHCSNINCRTLRKRWDALTKNQKNYNESFEVGKNILD